MSYSDTLTEKRNALIAKAEAITELAQSEERELTANEDVEIAAALEEVRSLDEQIQRHAELEQQCL